MLHFMPHPRFHFKEHLKMDKNVKKKDVFDPAVNSEFDGIFNGHLELHLVVHLRIHLTSYIKMH